MPSSIAFSLIFSLALALLVHDGVNCQTTPAIERIFLGRCAYFTQFGYMKPNVNCVQAWQEFRGAFASKDPCKVPKAAYAKYFSITGQVPPKDKAKQSRADQVELTIIVFYARLCCGLARNSSRAFTAPME